MVAGRAFDLGLGVAVLVSVGLAVSGVGWVGDGLTAGTGAGLGCGAGGLLAGAGGGVLVATAGGAAGAPAGFP